MNPKGRWIAEGSTVMCKAGTKLEVDTTVAGVKELKACAVYPDCVPSNVELVLIAVAQVATPIFDYAAGVVTLDSDFAESTIFYTKDGSDPKVSRECAPETAATLLYSDDAPIVIDTNLAGKRELRAMAVCVGSVHSDIAHIDVELEEVAAPELTFDNKTITLKSSTPGAAVVFALDAQKRDAHDSVEISQGGKHTFVAHAQKGGMVTSGDVTLDLDIQQTAAPEVECNDGVVTMDSAGSIFYQWDKAPSTPAAGAGLEMDALEDGTLRFHSHERLVMEPGPHVIHAVAVEEGKLPSHVVTVGVSVATQRAMIREVPELCPMKIPVKISLTNDRAHKKPAIATVSVPKVTQKRARLEIKCDNESALVVYDYKEGVPKMPEAYSGPGKGFYIDLPNPPDGETLWLVAVQPGMVPSKVESFKINLSEVKKEHEEQMSKAALAARAELEAAEAEAKDAKVAEEAAAAAAAADATAAEERAAAAQKALATAEADAKAAAAAAEETIAAAGRALEAEAAAAAAAAEETIAAAGRALEADAAAAAAAAEEAAAAGQFGGFEDAKEDEPEGFGGAAESAAEADAPAVNETPAAVREPDPSDGGPSKTGEEAAVPASTGEVPVKKKKKKKKTAVDGEAAAASASPGAATTKKKKKKPAAESAAAAAAVDGGEAERAKITKKSVGSRCKVEGFDVEGTVRFYGKSNEPPNKIRVGVELDEPVGKHNGTFKKHEYFSCPAKHGVLVVKSKVTLL